jgi:hypothetical protein
VPDTESDFQHGRDGLSVHPIKGNKQKIVSLKTRTVLPAFHKENDVSHVALVPTVILGGQYLTSLILTTCDFTFKSEDLPVLRWIFAAHIVPPAAT